MATQHTSLLHGWTGHRRHYPFIGSPGIRANPTAGNTHTFMTQIVVLVTATSLLSKIWPNKKAEFHENRYPVLVGSQDTPVYVQSQPPRLHRQLFPPGKHRCATEVMTEPSQHALSFARHVVSICPIVLMTLWSILYCLPFNRILSPERWPSGQTHTNSTPC